MGDDTEEDCKGILLAMNFKTEPPDELMDEANYEDVGSKDNNREMIEPTGLMNEVKFGAKTQDGELEATHGPIDKFNDLESASEHQDGDMIEATDRTMNEANEVEMKNQNGEVIVVNPNLDVEEETYDMAYVILDNDAGETIDSTNQDSSVTQDSEASSSLIAGVPNDEATEQPLNFELVFPYGHNFLLNKEVAPTEDPLHVDGASDNGEQYEDYNQWLSRVSREFSAQPSVAGVRGGGKRGRGVRFSLPARDTAPDSSPRFPPRPFSLAARAAADRRLAKARAAYARSENARAARALTLDANLTATPVDDLLLVINDVKRARTARARGAKARAARARTARGSAGSRAVAPDADPAVNSATDITAPTRFPRRPFSRAARARAAPVTDIAATTATAPDRATTPSAPVRSGNCLERNFSLLKTKPIHFCEFGDKTTHVCVDHDYLTYIVSDIVKSLKREFAKGNPESEATNKKRKRLKDNSSGAVKYEETFCNDSDVIAFKALHTAADALLLDEGKFDWWTMLTFRAVRETFEPAQAGSVATHATIYGAFREYWTDEILGHIVTATNEFANSPLRSKEFKSQWYDTNTHEILALFAFWIMLGIIKVPTLKACFSNDPLMKMNIFRTIFKRSRYERLVTALHFWKKSNKPNECRMHCFGPVLDHLNVKFQSNFTPAQNVSIDDSLLLLKNANFAQYSTKKIVQLGSTFELSDSATGYLWSFVVYTGENTSNTNQRKFRNLMTTIVLKLMRPLLNKGHTLFMGSCFNSPALARFLKKSKTDCVGTIDASSTGFPAFVKAAHTSPGKYVARHSNDLCILAWHDQSKECFISTYHGIQIGEVAKTDADQCERSWAPQLVIDYNQNMKEADQRDQSLEPYMTARKGTKWYIRFFKRLLSRSIQNAQILVEITRKMKLDSLATRLQLVDSILKRHLSLCPVSKESTNPVPQWRSNGADDNVCASDNYYINGTNCTNCTNNGNNTNGTFFGHWPVRITQQALSADGATVTLEAPNGDGATVSLATPSADDGATVTLEAPNVDGATVSLATPSADDGATVTLEARNVDVATVTLQAPNGDGATVSLATPSADDGATVTQQAPNVDGATVSLATPSADNGATVTLEAPNVDGATVRLQAPSGDGATVAPNGDIAAVTLCTACLRRGTYTGTDYKCELCDVPLCISCFKDFHVKSD